jgi:propionyl-CoA carboxylase alpha chain
MGRALEDFHIEGLGHNIPFLASVMDQDRFRSGKLSTNYIADEFPEGFHGAPPTPWQRDLVTAVAAWAHRTLAARARRVGNGLTSPLARRDWVVVVGKQRRDVALSDDGSDLVIDFPGEDRSLRLGAVDWRPGAALFRGRLDGVAFTVTLKPASEGFVIRHRAATTKVLVLTPASADLHERLPEKAPPDTSRLVISPMPGLVVSMEVEVGEEVKEGQIVCVIEAMKMQNIIRAERDGVIKTLGARTGDSVSADDVLAELA